MVEHHKTDYLFMGDLGGCTGNIWIIFYHHINIKKKRKLIKPRRKVSDVSFKMSFLKQEGVCT